MIRHPVLTERNRALMARKRHGSSRTREISHMANLARRANKRDVSQALANMPKPLKPPI